MKKKTRILFEEWLGNRSFYVFNLRHVPRVGETVALSTGADTYLHGTVRSVFWTIGTRKDCDVVVVITDEDALVQRAANY
jgi:hypothetical protein